MYLKGIEYLHNEIGWNGDVDNKRRVRVVVELRAGAVLIKFKGGNDRRKSTETEKDEKKFPPIRCPPCNGRVILTFPTNVLRIVLKD